MKPRSAENKASEMQRRLDAYVEEHNMRRSPTRDLVLAEACKLPQPFAASELIEAAEKQHISMPTVYNVLQLLIKARILLKVNRDSTREHAMYEILAGKSYTIQMYCTRCGRVTPVQSKVLNNAIKAYKFNNFNLQRFSLFVYGECKVCRSYKRLY
jgi:Fe2+ or Zn2+ uptake regulation protein